MKNKSIDINQRIPLDALNTALIGHLSEEYDENYILQQLSLDFKGENRLKKSLRIINKIILKNPLGSILLENKEEILNACKRRDDRNLILIALLNASFPFSFDVMRIFGKYLSVQDIVNTESINKAVANIYGGNRATEIGIYSVIPMFIEACFIKRPKIGLYQINENFNLSTSIGNILFKESLKVNAEYNTFFYNEISDPYLIFINNNN